jgi:hypothetical protein
MIPIKIWTQIYPLEAGVFFRDWQADMKRIITDDWDLFVEEKGWEMLLANLRYCPAMLEEWMKKNPEVISLGIQS